MGCVNSSNVDTYEEDVAGRSNSRKDRRKPGCDAKAADAPLVQPGLSGADATKEHEEEHAPLFEAADEADAAAEASPLDGQPPPAGQSQQQQQQQKQQSQQQKSRHIPLEAADLFKDRDGDLAHEFWEEDPKTGKLLQVKTTDLRRV